jgi:hypothetical protein
MHPLEGDIQSLKDDDLENKLRDLNKRYLTASRLGNQSLAEQVLMLLTSYRQEQIRRQRKSFDDAIKKSQGEVNGDLSELVNVDKR